MRTKPPRSRTGTEAFTLGGSLGDNPMDAKAEGKTVQNRPDWDNLKVDVMLVVVRSKFARDADLRKKLRATRGQQLAEGHAGDRFWGGRRNHLRNISCVCGMNFQKQRAFKPPKRFGAVQGLARGFYKILAKWTWRQPRSFTHNLDPVCGGSQVFPDPEFVRGTQEIQSIQQVPEGAAPVIFLLMLAMVGFMNCFSFWLLGRACEHVRTATQEATYILVVRELLPCPLWPIAGAACLLYPVGTCVTYVKLTHDSLFGNQKKPGLIPDLSHASWLQLWPSAHRNMIGLVLLTLFVIGLVWLWQSRAQPRLCDLYILLCASIAGVFTVLLVGLRAEDHGSSLKVITLAALFLYLPLSCLRDIKPLRLASAIAVLSGFVLVSVALSYGPQDGHDGTSTEPSTSAAAVCKIYKVWSILVVSFTAHYNAPQYYRELGRGNRLEEFWKGTFSSFVFVFVAYFLCAWRGYCLYGSRTQQDLLDNFADAGSDVAPMAHGAYLLIVWADFPKILNGVRELSQGLLLGSDWFDQYENACLSHRARTEPGKGGLTPGWVPGEPYFEEIYAFQGDVYSETAPSFMMEILDTPCEMTMEVTQTDLRYGDSQETPELGRPMQAPLLLRFFQCSAEVDDNGGGEIYMVHLSAWGHTRDASLSTKVLKPGKYLAMISIPAQYTCHRMIFRCYSTRPLVMKPITQHRSWIAVNPAMPLSAIPYSLCGFQRVDAVSEKLPQMFDEASGLGSRV
ncbi:unnamed protein product [Symbiodinium natans]|uniref:Uncharacterized protein n=1 Tax=Symbiodinium natans TaxID=878477 RepID=A0A812T5E0_9DINO|nr:unnamed protein product [Symbiodinium natans]